MAVGQIRISVWEALSGHATGWPAVPADPVLWAAVVERLDPAAEYWILDFTGVGYISSMGLRALVKAEKRLRARHGALVLASTWGFGPPIVGPGVVQGESVIVVLLPVILFAAVRFGTGGASLEDI